jgi:hypothetical protein
MTGTFCSPNGRLEDGADGTESQAADVLVRAVRKADGAEDVQFTPRSVRERHVRAIPARQKPAAFNLDAAQRQIEEAARSANR